MASDLKGKVGSLLGHRALPIALALVAVIFMLPALGTGLLGDDLIQRLVQFTPAELPPRMLDTGFVHPDSGTLGTVLVDLFGYIRTEDSARQARDFGIGPWWATESLRIALWRPFTAFTHWLDYRVFPGIPALMHLHNILWYAAVVYLAAVMYRRIGVFSASQAGSIPAEGEARRMRSAGIAAGVAAVLFLLDKNTYVPVMYVANRGFIVSLAFGLICLGAHHRWRATGAESAMWFSMLWLLLSLLANEGGASTLAFLLAYAAVLEPANWRRRAMSLLPAATVVAGWRIVYVASGFGVRNFVGYIDPGYSPALFLKHLIPRTTGLLGGQLSGLPPEVAFLLNPEWRVITGIAFAFVAVLAAAAFWPVLKRDRAARYWAVVMLLALVPAATVAPLTKNMTFIAMGAFGVIASFLVNFTNPAERAAMPGPLRSVAWCVAVVLLLAHVAGTLAARVGLALASPKIPELAVQCLEMEGSPDIGDRELVVVNDPALMPTMLTFSRAYQQRPLPKSIRVLAPGSNPIEVTRADARTLVLKAKAGDLFDCPRLGPANVSYLSKAANEFVFSVPTLAAGAQVRRKGMVAEVLEVGANGAPRQVAFHFEDSLDARDKVWMFFNWRRMAHQPFVLPKIGQTVEIKGAGS